MRCFTRGCALDHATEQVGPRCPAAKTRITLREGSPRSRFNRRRITATLGESEVLQRIASFGLTVKEIGVPSVPAFQRCVANPTEFSPFDAVQQSLSEPGPG